MFFQALWWFWHVLKFQNYYLNYSPLKHFSLLSKGSLSSYVQLNSCFGAEGVVCVKSINFNLPGLYFAVLVILHYPPGKRKCYLMCFAVSRAIIFAYAISSVQSPLTKIKIKTF